MKKISVISFLFVLVFLLFVSCKNVVVEEVSVSATERDATSVNYYLQNVLCDNYALESSEELKISANTKISDIEKHYDGFTARGFSQNGSILNVYYDRNIINIRLDLNGGKSSYSVLNYEGIYGSSMGKVCIPEKEGYVFQGFFNGEKKLTGAFPTESGTFKAKWKEINGWAPEGFVYVKGGTVVGDKKYASAPSINTCQGVFVAKRTVTLSDFYIAKYEVTKKLYKSVMGDASLNTYGIAEDPSLSTSNSQNQYRAPGEVEELLPVEGMTWCDAVYFCNLLSQKEGLDPVYTITNPKFATSKMSNSSSSFKYIENATVKIDLTKNGYRLPTEAEWEYAARGGDPDAEEFAYNYPTTYSETYEEEVNYDLDSICWYTNNSNEGQTLVFGKEGFAPHQVGLKQPNTLGLYDMAGNVSEYVNDGYGSMNSAPGCDKGTFTNPLVEKGDHHIARGGHFFSNGRFVSVSYRNYVNSSDYALRNNFKGIRLVRSKGLVESGMSAFIK